MNNSWPRGYQRKGTALFYLDRLDEAIEAYKQGLQHDPNNQQLKNDLKAAEDKQKGPGANPMMNEQYLGAMMKLLGNTETKDFIQDQSFMQKVQAVMQNPALLSMFQDDPKIKKAMEVIGSPDANPFNFEEMMKNMGKQGPKGAKKEEESSKMDEQPPAPPKQEEKKQEKKEEKKVELSPAE